MYTININRLDFEWDGEKERGNRLKHGVSFDEAKTAFEDEDGRLFYDPDHSDDEDRFLLLGMSDKLRLLVVSHCWPEGDDSIRIISARKATPREAQSYGN